MGRLEDALRETLADHVAAPPALAGVADRAIAAAGRARRRRAMASSVAAALCVTLVGAAVVLGGGRLTGSPEGLASPGPVTASRTAAPDLPLVAGLPVEVMVLLGPDSGLIFTPSGATVALPDLAPLRAWRVADGWLVEHGNGRQLWLVTESGSRSLLVEGDAVMVSPGSPQRPGPQVAWAAGGVLRVGTYRAGQVIDPVTTAGVESAAASPLGPQRVVGGSVLLAGTTTGGGLDIWDYWTPGRGDYVPSADNPGGFAAMIGATADNRSVIGIYHDGSGAKAGCLARFDPDGLVPQQSTCAHTFGIDDQVVPSPDGRWWAVIRPGGVALYDAATVWSGAEPVQTWPLETKAIAWRDPTSFVVTVGGEATVTTLSVAGAAPVATVRLPQPYPHVLVVGDLRR